LLASQKNSCDLPDAPVPTHGVPGGHPIQNVGNTIQFLSRVAPGTGDGMIQVGRYIITGHIAEHRQLTDDCDKVEAHKPAMTIRRANIVQHYSQPRELTVREKALLQSFPRDYIFCGSVRDQNNQTGNAVPVNLAYAVAKSVMKSHEFDRVAIE